MLSRAVLRREREAALIDRYARPRMKHVWSEEHRYDLWLRVELAVCEAWAAQGVIPAGDMAKLRGARHDLELIEEIFERTRHDMTAFTRSITQNLGPEGRWIHLGLTSNDVIDTAQDLQMVEAADLLAEGVEALLETLSARAVEFKDTLMMGRTHGVHAEPITFGLKLALWTEEMRRHQHRLARAREEIAVGKVSGAVGTYATLSPEIEERACAELGLKPDSISNQVVQRDRHAQFVTTLALMAASLEKFATEVRHLQRTEVREVEEPFGEGQTGSSAMPHKRNPELSERVCGLARLIRGYAVTSMENVALWHERDISHSSAERLILPDSCMALDYILDLFTSVIRGLRVYPNRMLQNVESSRGLVFSQRVLLALIEKGTGREEAYKTVQDHAMRAWDTGEDFRDLLRADPAVTSHLQSQELENLFDYGYYTRYVEQIFLRLGLG
jgi:adenylosuccinate lyase